MKVIFLDVDGVLNCIDTTDLCGGYVGIENAKVKLLRRIVEATGAEIVLTSTWKDGWSKTDKDKKQDVFGCFLDRELERESLVILDKTEDDGVHRGKGIRDWMKSRDVESFVILDDHHYDYLEQGLSGCHVKTEFYDENGGLNEEHVVLAVEKLGLRKPRIDEMTLGVLICYRNQYCSEGNDTENGIVANAINEVLPILFEAREEDNDLQRKTET